jgi:hypothetical protein
MGKRAREVAVDRFDEQRVLPIYRQLYERVMAE